MLGEGIVELVPEGKKGLLELLGAPVRCGDQTGPLMVALHRMVASLVRCFERVAKRLDIPVAPGDEGVRGCDAVEVES